MFFYYWFWKFQQNIGLRKTRYTQTSNIHVSVAARYQKISAKSWYAKLQNINQTRQANLCVFLGCFFQTYFEGQTWPKCQRMQQTRPGHTCQDYVQKNWVKTLGRASFSFFSGVFSVVWELIWIPAISRPDFVPRFLRKPSLAKAIKIYVCFANAGKF